MKSGTRLSPISVTSPIFREEAGRNDRDRDDALLLHGLMSKQNSFADENSTVRTVGGTWSRDDFHRTSRLKPSKVLPLSPLKPNFNNSYCTPTKSKTSAFDMSAFTNFGVIETNFETDECSYMSVHSTNMPLSDIQTRINTHLVYYRNQSGDILSYRRKMQNGRSNLGYKANRGKLTNSPSDMSNSLVQRCSTA